MRHDALPQGHEEITSQFSAPTVQQRLAAIRMLYDWLVTIYLQNGGALENAQRIAAHESSQMTKLYDRTSDEITVP